MLAHYISHISSALSKTSLKPNITKLEQFFNRIVNLDNTCVTVRHLESALVISFRQFFLSLCAFFFF